MRVSPIYLETAKELKLGTRRIVHQGGMASGKTVNILGALAHLAAEDTYGITTVTAMSFPHLKGGALRDFETFVYPSFKNEITKYHKTDHLFTFKNGHQIEFKVFENEMSARGPKRKRLFINEANKFDYLTYFQLDKRSEQTVLDYNPSIRFWCHEHLIDKDGTKLFLSDHRHNPFLSKQKHQEIEDVCIFDLDENGKKRRNEKGEPLIISGNYELWKVYARGITGNVTGIIFPDWRIIDDSYYSDDEDFIFGIDFGYTNDPTCIVKVYRVGENLFVHELAYEPGLSTKGIIAVLQANGYTADMPLYCEHDPDMIRDLRNYGVMALHARKGQGSINAGIQLLKQFKVFYTLSSINIDRERGLYVWESDKVDGKSTNIPVDRNNHTFDAIRYAVYSKYLKIGL
jgi:phage terminase large subunit